MSESPLLTGPKRRSSLRWLWIGLVLIVGAASAPYTCPWLRTRAPISQDADLLQQKITEIEKRVDAMDTELQSLKTQGTAGIDNKDLAHLQSDIAAMATALSSLHNEVQQNNTQTQQASQSVIAEALMLVQLREAVATGHAYTTELTAMKQIASNDKATLEILTTLDPYADKGVPSLGMLHEMFETQATIAANAVEKDSAQNWGQRVVAEMKSMISIRPLHGNATADGFEAIDTDLANNDVTAALKAEAALPTTAQNILQDWRDKAEARQKAETALHQLFDHLTRPKP